MINLREYYGKQYKIFLDESWEYMENKSEEEKPWCYELRGKYGLIYPYDDSTLAVMVTSESIKGRLKRNFKGRVATFWDGDGEGVFLFDPGLIYEIAEMIRARRRRQLSPEAKEKLANRGREALKRYRKTNLGSKYMAQI